MEYEAERFYRKAAEKPRATSRSASCSPSWPRSKSEHENLAHKLGETILTKDARAKEDETERRMFVLQYVQPGLAGLMDGSVSTLAPLFAAAFATHNTWETFLVGLAASVGAGISMAFAEALSDDGSLTGRGTPWISGSITGLMTAIGGLGHTLPYLIPDFWTRDGSGLCRGGGRACGDLLDSPPLHGHALPVGGVSGHGRRRTGLRGRDIDRQLLMFTLAHVSDVHLAPLPTPRPSELLSKRGLGYLNWLRKRRAIHRADMLAALVADLKARAPDHIAVTGDLVNLSLTKRVCARRAIGSTALGEPRDVTFVPGNHDAYVRQATTVRRAALGRVHAGRRRRKFSLRSKARAGRADRALDIAADAAARRNRPTARRAARAPWRSCWTSSSASRCSASC